MKIANEKQLSFDTIIPPRGLIFARGNELLASNISSYELAVDPKMLKNRDTFSVIIEQHLGISKDSVLKRISSSKSRHQVISKKISVEQVKIFRDLNDPGIKLKEIISRHYNYGSTTSQVVGILNSDNVALSGLELSMDTVLSPIKGLQYMYRTPAARKRPAFNFDELDKGRAGYDVYLTIDLDLQSIVEYELKKMVAAEDAVSATVVAINPNTGEVLSMYSFPSYDPHNRNDPNTFLRNKTIEDPYEPGSTFKGIITTIALEKSGLKVTDQFNGYNGV